MNMRKLFTVSNRSKSTKWLLYLLAASIVFLVLALATAPIGGSAMTGTTGIPGPGFFIFGLLLLISSTLFAFLLLYKTAHYLWDSIKN